MLPDSGLGFWYVSRRDSSCPARSAYTQSSHPQLAQHITSSSDHEAMSYLIDVELKAETNDPRPFELVFVSLSLYVLRWLTR